MNHGTRELSRLLKLGSLVPMAGVYDALSARLAEQAGLKMVFLSGYCLSASRLGLPDFGFVSLPDLVDAAAHITGRVEIPLVADGDTGFGGPLMVQRLVRALEMVGAAGLQIEDQSSPKRCGHMGGKGVIPRDEMVAKIHAALDARRDDGFMIIARTDAVSVTGFADAVDRAQAYCDAGADAIFVEAPETEAQISSIPGLVSRPAVFNWALGGKSPLLPAAEIAALGYRFIQCPDVVFNVAHALAAAYGAIAAEGTYAAVADRMMPFHAFNEMLGLDEIAARERRYTPADAGTTR
jgi:2-methylisocitrate lyase-like PEP mutase family enzyme